MSSLVGLLKVSLQSDTAEFSRGFDRASDRANRFGVDMEKAGRLAAAGVAAVGATIATFVAQTARAGDEINKLADRTGITTEALSRLKYAADLSDVSVSDLETAFSGLSRRMLQAQQGTGAAAEAFAALGIRTAEADGSLRKVDDVLLDVADAFSKSSDATANAALAQELFGRAGTNLLPLLRQGADGIREMGDEAEGLGLVFSQGAADAASEFQDNLTRLQGAATGVAYVIGNTLIPKINELVEEFFAAREAGLDWWESLTRIGLSDPTKSLGEQLARVRGEIEKTIQAIERPGASDAFRAARLRELEILQKEAAYYEILIERRNRAADAGDDEANSTDGITRALREMRAEQERAKKAAEERRKQETEANRAAREAAAAAAKMATERRREIEAAQEGLRSIGEQIQSQQEYNEEIGLSARALVDLRYQRVQQAAAALEERASTIALIDPNSELVDIYRQQAEALRTLAEEQRTGALSEASADAARAAEQEWLNTSRSIEQSLTDALLRGFESGADFAENFRRTLLNMFQTLVLRPIIQPIIAGGLGVLGMGSAAASGGAGGAGGGGGGIGSLLSGFNPMSFLGGNSIGMGISNVAAYLAQTNMLAGTGAGNALLGFSGNVAGMSNLGFGVSGLLGGLGANLLFGGKGYSGTGGSLGSMAGFALGGPVGAVIGTLLGGGIGSLFGGSGERFPRTVASSRSTYSDGRFEGLGPDPEFFPGDDQFGGSMERALEGLQRAFSQRLGGLLEAFDLEADIETTAQTRLRRTSGRLVGALFGTIGDAAFEFRGQFGEDAEIEESFAEFVETALTQGIAEAIRQSSLPENIRNIFAEELSGEQIDAAVDTLTGVADLKGRLESMPAVFGKLSASIDEVLEAEDFNAFSDAAEQFGQLRNSVQSFYDLFTSDADKFRDAQRSLAYEFDNLGVSMPQSIADFRRLADGLDLATDDGRELFNSLMGLAPAFLTVAQAVEDTFDAISASTAETVEQFLFDTMSARERYAYFDNRIADTLESLETAFDPATIGSLYQQANSDLRDAWNLLSESEQMRLRDEFIERAYQLEELFQDRLSVVPDDAADDNEAMGQAVGQAVSQALTAVVDRLALAGVDQATSAEALRAAVADIPSRIVIEVGGGYGEVGQR